MNRILYIQLNLICNCKCIFCCSDVLYKDSFSPKEIEYNHLLNEIEKFDLNEDDYIVIDGGEPTLYERLGDLLSYLKNKRVYVKLFSNGRSFIRAKYAEILLENIDEIIIPLYAYSPKIHDKITRKEGSFKETLLGLKNICKLKEEKFTNLKIIINLLYSKMSLKENPKILTLLRKFPQISFFTLNTLYVSRTTILNKNKVVPSQSELTHSVYATLNFAEKKGFISCIFNVSIPYCIIPQKYLSYFTPLPSYQNDIYYRIDPFFPYIHEQERINSKIELCGNCYYKSICNFDIKSYLDL